MLFAGELLRKRPVPVVPNEDIRAIAIEGGGDTMALDHVSQEQSVTMEIFVRTCDELQDGTRRIVDSTQERERIGSILTPAVLAGIHENQGSATCFSDPP